MVLTGAGLLVLLVVLKQSIGSASDTPARSPTSSEDSASEGSTATPAAGTPPHGNRDAKLPPLVPGTPARAAPSGDPTAPSLPAGDPASDPDKPKKRPPVANKTILREQVEAVAPLVEACVASATGKKDGTAAMHFILAPKGTEAVVELTAVDEDGTTIQNEAMLECMHKTALQMKFTPTPDSDAVVAKREVVVENGKVTVNRLVDFSYLRK